MRPADNAAALRWTFDAPNRLLAGNQFSIGTCPSYMWYVRIRAAMYYKHTYMNLIAACPSRTRCEWQFEKLFSSSSGYVSAGAGGWIPLIYAAFTLICSECFRVTALSGPLIECYYYYSNWCGFLLTDCVFSLFTFFSFFGRQEE